MARKNYTIDEVLQSLRKKHDVRVEGKYIKILNPTAQNATGDCGNGTHGMIDFLCKNGFVSFHVDSFTADLPDEIKAIMAQETVEETVQTIKPKRKISVIKAGTMKRNDLKYGSTKTIPVWD